MYWTIYYYYYYKNNNLQKISRHLTFFQHISWYALLQLIYMNTVRFATGALLSLLCKGIFLIHSSMYNLGPCDIISLSSILVNAKVSKKGYCIHTKPFIITCSGHWLVHPVQTVLSFYVLGLWSQWILLLTLVLPARANLWTGIVWLCEIAHPTFKKSNISNHTH